MNILRELTFVPGTCFEVMFMPDFGFFVAEVILMDEWDIPTPPEAICTTTSAWGTILRHLFFPHLTGVLSVDADFFKAEIQALSSFLQKHTKVERMVIRGFTDLQPKLLCEHGNMFQNLNSLQAHPSVALRILSTFSLPHLRTLTISISKGGEVADLHALVLRLSSEWSSAMTSPAGKILTIILDETTAQQLQELSTPASILAETKASLDTTQKSAAKSPNSRRGPEPVGTPLPKDDSPAGDTVNGDVGTGGVGAFPKHSEGCAESKNEPAFILQLHLLEWSHKSLDKGCMAVKQWLKALELQNANSVQLKIMVCGDHDTEIVSKLEAEMKGFTVHTEVETRINVWMKRLLETRAGLEGKSDPAPPPIPDTHEYTIHVADSPARETCPKMQSS
ncbi:hypothetical protein DFH07DRAFT_783310 [Mycena maculata]|uniref:Uncharacterized protein n=1 Tax=Mycena maculata TaxID=230809 RepID=A0AAD7MMV0_9AGAR|nr:hypothetical protein DFH07DRAFT_783310 [Mycena maculata]